MKVIQIQYPLTGYILFREIHPILIPYENKKAFKRQMTKIWGKMKEKDKYFYADEASFLRKRYPKRNHKEQLITIPVCFRISALMDSVRSSGEQIKQTYCQDDDWTQITPTFKVAEHFPWNEVLQDLKLHKFEN